MQCRRTIPQSSLPTSPSHKPTYTNAIPMDFWSISNPTGHPVRSQAHSGIHPQSHWSPCAFTGALAIPRGSLCVSTTYLTRDSSARRVCSPSAGFNPPEFLSPCCLPVWCCLATSPVRSQAVAPPRGPALSSLGKDLHGSRRHESAIRGVRQAEGKDTPQLILTNP